MGSSGSGQQLRCPDCHDITFIMQVKWRSSCSGALKRQSRVTLTTGLRLSREKVDRLGRGYRFDVFRLEAEQLDALYQLAFQILVAKFAGDNFAE